MKIIFDFDDVLFNNKKFKKHLFLLLASRGYHDAEKIYETWRSTGEAFDIFRFLRSLDTSLTDTKVEEFYEEILGFCGECINEKVLEIMKEVGGDNCYILTNGIERFQKDKIQRSIGLDMAKEIIIVRGSKKEEIKEICVRYPSEEIIFVDDKVLYLNDIKGEGYENLKTVLFNEHGLENLKAEIEASRKEEYERTIQPPPNVPPSSLGMH